MPKTYHCSNCPTLMVEDEVCRLRGKVYCLTCYDKKRGIDTMPRFDVKVEQVVGSIATVKIIDNENYERHIETGLNMNVEDAEDLSDKLAVALNMIISRHKG